MTSLTEASDVCSLENALVVAATAGCPPEELEVAKAELIELRKLCVLPLVLRGATGSNADIVNGMYHRTNETINGKPVFEKWGMFKCLMCFAANEKWYVMDPADRDSEILDGFAQTEAGLAHPRLAKEWWVDNEDNGWEVQTLRISIMVSFKKAPAPPIFLLIISWISFVCPLLDISAAMA